MRNMEMIDTHAHIYVDKFKKDIEEILKNARNSGVSAICMPNIDEDSLADMLDLASQHPDFCHAMIGLHPCSVDKNYNSILSELETYISRPGIVGIGETGIDLYWDESTRPLQEDAFRVHLEWAKAHQLPIIIHSRNSLDLTIEMVAEYQDGSLKGIFHCFDGTVDQSRMIGDLGFYVGIGGIVTYRKSSLSEVIPQLDISNMVLETDAPYLPPVPFRGRRNESSYLVFIAKQIATLMRIGEEEIRSITTSNAKKVFGLL